MKLDFGNEAFQHVPLLLAVQLVKNLVEHLEGSIDGIDGDVLSLNRLPALLALRYLVLDFINLVVNPVQAGIHVRTLALGVPVLVGDGVDVPLQVGLAPGQLLQRFLVSGDFRLDFGTVHLLPDFGLNVLGKLGVLHQ